MNCEKMFFRVRFCPAMQDSPALAVLDAFPDKVNPNKDKNWKFVEAWGDTPAGGLKMTTTSYGIKQTVVMKGVALNGRGAVEEIGKRLRAKGMSACLLDSRLRSAPGWRRPGSSPAMHKGKTMQDLSRDGLIKAAQEASAQVGSGLSRVEFARLTGIGEHQIASLFPEGRWTELKELAGLDGTPGTGRGLMTTTCSASSIESRPRWAASPHGHCSRTRLASPPTSCASGLVVFKALSPHIATGSSERTGFATPCGIADTLEARGTHSAGCGHWRRPALLPALGLAWTARIRGSNRLPRTSPRASERARRGLPVWHGRVTSWASSLRQSTQLFRIARRSAALTWSVSGGSGCGSSSSIEAARFSSMGIGLTAVTLSSAGNTTGQTVRSRSWNSAVRSTGSADSLRGR